MSTSLRCDANAAALPRLPSALGNVMRALVQRVDASREASRRAAEDRAILTNMSDRDLLDIGIARGSANAVADRTWLRDYPY